jgi:segregation and condensation protein B
MSPSAPRRGKRSKSDAPEARSVAVSDVAPAPDAEQADGEGVADAAPEPEAHVEDAVVEAISASGDIERPTELESEGEGAAEQGVAPEDEAVAAAEGEGAQASTGATGPLSRERLKTVLESLIFVSDHTVTAQQLARMVKVKLNVVREVLGELAEDYRERGIELIEVAGGFQFRSAASSAEYVREYVAQRPVRLTRAQLETLALIAYRQPITRPEIDEVRGVDSGSAVRVLLERDLIKMLGRKDEPGRPLLYGSTPYFLEFFGMRSLKDLPTLREFTELNEENRALFKRKTGEEVADAEAALLAAEEAAQVDGEQAAHISDEDLAELVAQADAAEAEAQEETTSVWSDPPAETAPEPTPEDAPSEPMSDEDLARLSALVEDDDQTEPG